MGEQLGIPQAGKRPLRLIRVVSTDVESAADAPAGQAELPVGLIVGHELVLAAIIRRDLSTSAADGPLVVQVLQSMVGHPSCWDLPAGLETDRAARQLPDGQDLTPLEHQVVVGLAKTSVDKDDKRLRHHYHVSRRRSAATPPSGAKGLSEE